MTNNITKAKKAQIKLGDIEIDVYQLPDGSYRVSSTNLSEIFGGTEKQYRPKFMAEGLKALLPEHLETVQIDKISTEGSGNKINALPLEMVSFVAMYQALKGNQKAQTILQATLVEALERRADSAFGQIRTEEERNQRLQARMDGILSRNFWTDTIAWYLENNEVSDNYRKFLYPNVSDAVNRAFVGLAARKIEARLPEKKKVRDCLPAEMLKQIDAVERMAGLAVTNRGKEPLEAIREAIAFVNPTPDSSWLD